jgi:hypothetical protein
VTRFRHLIRSSIVLIVGTAFGALIGWLVFSVSTLSGKPLFAVEGSLIGLVISAVFIGYTRRSDTFALSEITVSVPEFAEMKFAVNSEYRRVAWKLFVETLTRVAAQPLATEHGSLRVAMDSLYSLFTGTRDLLKNMHPSKPTTDVTVEVFAVKMLNQEIRPFLSKWNVLLEEFESREPHKSESDWSENANCRKELEALRNRLISYTRAFGELAGLKNTERFLTP